MEEHPLLGRAGVSLEILPKDDAGLIEYKRSLIEAAFEFFDSLEHHGNTRAKMAEAIAYTLNQVQDVVVPYLDGMEEGDAHKFNRSMMMCLVMVRVALRNPMYDTPALTLQLRAEIEATLDGAPGIALDADG